MKDLNKLLKSATILICSIGLIMISFSCEEDKAFDFGPTQASYGDGIQNLDEEGVDCGGGSGVDCPSCSDGVQNQDETGIDCGGALCEVCPDATPRADALQDSGLPYFYTFESNDPKSGLNIQPRANDVQGVDLFYGEADPDGTVDVVTRVVRPDDGRFGGFEDMKFEQKEQPIDFSAFSKFTLEVYIPEGQDFSGALEPQVELILHDNNADFFLRWTVISKTIAEEDFGSWVTLFFDGATAAAANDGTLLPSNMSYDNITLRFGGSNHTESGTFFIKDFLPTTSLVAEGTPRADALANSSLPVYFTFETGDATSGLNLIPRDAENLAVGASYGVPDPAGSSDAVGRIVRPENGGSGGFEDFKFQPQEENIDFSVFNKFKLDVYIPSSNDFSGNLEPLVELILHDTDDNFFQRWTVISAPIDEADFDTWVTVEFDGAEAASAADGTLLPANTSYQNYTLRFGGSGHFETGEFFVRDFVPTTGVEVAEGTPRADALANSSLPLYFTFETGDATSGLNLIPRVAENLAVGASYGVPDPAGSSDAVAKIVRPENGSSGGFEDFKFQPQEENIDFSVFNKFKLDVYIPSSNDFSGSLAPVVELILHDNDANFFERWTVISVAVEEADFDTWVTLEFDGTMAASAADGTLLPANTSYQNFTLRFGGSGHFESGEFFVRDFVPFN